MQIYLNPQGSLKQPTKIYCNPSGSLKSVRAVYTNVGGVIKLLWPAGTQLSSGGVVTLYSSSTTNRGTYVIPAGTDYTIKVIADGTNGRGTYRFTSLNENDDHNHLGYQNYYSGDYFTRAGNTTKGTYIYKVHVYESLNGDQGWWWEENTWSTTQDYCTVIVY